MIRALAHSRFCQRTLVRGAIVLAVGMSAPAMAMEIELALTAPMAGTQTVATVSAGVAPGTVNGFDAGIDTLSFRVGPLQAWFANPSEPRAEFLKRDIRSGATEEVWTLQLLTPATGTGAVVDAAGEVTVSWRPPVSGGVCSDRALTLDDGLGRVVDMGAVDSLTVPVPAAGVPHTLLLRIGVAGSAVSSAPNVPTGLVAPGRSRRGVLLAWQPVVASGYHVERITDPLDGALRRVTRITDVPLRDSRFLDAGTIGLAAVAYRVVAVSGQGCESAPSQELLIIP